MAFEILHYVRGELEQRELVIVGVTHSVGLEVCRRDRLERFVEVGDGTGCEVDLSQVASDAKRSHYRVVGAGFELEHTTIGLGREVGDRALGNALHEPTAEEILDGELDRVSALDPGRGVELCEARSCLT